jgi:hypothetical protein
MVAEENYEPHFSNGMGFFYFIFEGALKRDPVLCGWGRKAGLSLREDFLKYQKVEPDPHF